MFSYLRSRSIAFFFLLIGMPCFALEEEARDIAGSPSSVSGLRNKLLVLLPHNPHLTADEVVSTFSSINFGTDQWAFEEFKKFGENTQCFYESDNSHFGAKHSIPYFTAVNFISELIEIQITNRTWILSTAHFLFAHFLCLDSVLECLSALSLKEERERIVESSCCLFLLQIEKDNPDKELFKDYEEKDKISLRLYQEGKTESFFEKYKKYMHGGGRMYPKTSLYKDLMIGFLKCSLEQILKLLTYGRVYFKDMDPSLRVQVLRYISQKEIPAEQTPFVLSQWGFLAEATCDRGFPHHLGMMAAAYSPYGNADHIMKAIENIELDDLKEFCEFVENYILQKESISLKFNKSEFILAMSLKIARENRGALEAYAKSLPLEDAKSLSLILTSIAHEDGRFG